MFFVTGVGIKVINPTKEDPATALPEEGFRSHPED